MTDKLRIRRLTDQRAIAKLRKLDKEAKEGKRKTISNEEFTRKYLFLIS